MTLSEVIKSGKKFRRPGFAHEAWLHVVCDSIVFKTTGVVWSPTVQDINASDWELEDIKLSFTLKEILDAIKRASENAFDDEEFDIMIASDLGFYQTIWSGRVSQETEETLERFYGSTD